MLPACNPYQNFDGEYSAGAIDATNFAAPYLGTLPGPADQGGGVIAATPAWVGGSPVNYFMFPFTDSQNGQLDPLALTADAAPTPKGFVFDPAAGDAFPTPKCKGPANYTYDQRTEAWRADQQGAVFSTVPSSAGYIPVVSQVPVTSNGETCQSIKSKENILVRKDITMPANTNPDGNYLAWAIVDPSADVQPNGPDGLGPIHLGWYNHYLVTFLDGGYIPTEQVAPAGMMDMYTRMKAQALYVPTAVPGMDDNMNPIPVPGALGMGWDILETARGKTGYTPVCHAIKYTPDDPLNPKTSADDFSATEQASTGAADADLGFVFCLQP